MNNTQYVPRSPKEYGKVAVLLGGISAARDVSLKSGKAVFDALKRRGVDAHAVDVGHDIVNVLERGKFARAFNILHGRGGEDGTMQGILELIGLPYTGSGVMASALAMDKWRTKMIWQSAGIPTPRYQLLNANSNFDAVVDQLGLPLFVKPATEGSSIGITKVKRREDLRAAFEAAAKYDDLVIVEQFIDGKEIQFPVLNNEVLPSILIETPAEFYDYQAKYFRNDTRYTCPGLPPKEERALHEQILRSFQVLGCSGWGRVDVLLAADGTPHFLEMNTLPGMTDHSLVPMAAKVAGIDFDELVLRILDTSVGRTTLGEMTFDVPVVNS